MTFLYAAHSIKDWPYHVSAGGLVFKETDGKRLYALLYRGPQWHGEESWHLPKGTLSKDESLLAGAIREIKEESGLEGTLWGYLGSIQKGIKSPHGFYEKTTHYFLFEHLAGDGTAMDKEHDRLDWLDFDEAHERLSRGRTSKIKQEQDVVARAENLLGILKTPPKYE